jgi:hypothetical protein
VRIFGPAFELVRVWYQSGVPLSIVFRGIQEKAARHHAGRSKRPLRLEFCAADVDALFDDWRRATGIHARRDVDVPDPHVTAPHVEHSAGGRRATAGRQLQRAIDKLALTVGRLDVPEDVQLETTRLLEALSTLRESSRRARGEAKRDVVLKAEEIDRDLGRLARLSGRELLAEVEAEAAAELTPFRARLKPEDWHRSLAANVDRLLRGRLGIPTIDFEIDS